MKRQQKGSRDFELNIYVIEPLSDVQCLVVLLSGIFTWTTSSLVAGRCTIDSLFQAVYAIFGSSCNLKSPESGCTISSVQSVEFHLFPHYPDDLVIR